MIKTQDLKIITLPLPHNFEIIIDILSRKVQRFLSSGQLIPRAWRIIFFIGKKLRKNIPHKTAIYCYQMTTLKLDENKGERKGKIKCEYL